jgi:hypothetical protein
MNVPALYVEFLRRADVVERTSDLVELRRLLRQLRDAWQRQPSAFCGDMILALTEAEYLLNGLPATYYLATAFQRFVRSSGPPVRLVVS